MDRRNRKIFLELHRKHERLWNTNSSTLHEEKCQRWVFKKIDASLIGCWLANTLKKV